MPISREDEELLNDLGLDIEPEKVGAHTPLEERIMAGFEDILRFRETNGRAPQHGESRDIFERLYATRLDQIRLLPEAKSLLANMDRYGMLDGSDATAFDISEDDDALLALFGGADASDGESSITNLRNVRSTAEKREAEEVADRITCRDFAKFKQLFDLTKHELETGIRTSQPYKENASILEGQFFILSGQLTYVAEVTDETRVAPNGIKDARLRVIYDNGTESNLWQTSLRRALNKDEHGRRLTGSSDGPLFDNVHEPDDIETGTIYVLRSQSDHPFIAKNRELIHKIGVTGGSIEQRISGAEKQSTYLLACVEVVATYKLHNMNRTKVEKLFHKLFANARLKVEISDRFGQPVEPREWFLVPLHVIDEAVERLVDGSITEFVYDINSAQLSYQ